MDKKVAKTIAASLGATATVVAIQSVKKRNKIKEIEKAETLIKNFDPGKRKAYFIGGGLESLAGATYLIRDCKMEGKNIYIYEGKQSDKVNDGIKLNTGECECNSEVIENNKRLKRYAEFISYFNSKNNKIKCKALEKVNLNRLLAQKDAIRLLDKDGRIVEESTTEFESDIALAFAKLMFASQDKITNMTIQDWFEDTSNFFETSFWYKWKSTYGFQKWSSLLEFRRFLKRMTLDIGSVENLEKVAGMAYNHYENLKEPIRQFLKEEGVNFFAEGEVVDIDFKDDDTITVKALHLNRYGTEEVILLNEDDLLFMTNGSKKECMTLGDYKTPAKMETENLILAELWNKIAVKKKGLGEPAQFFSKPEETNLESFSIICKSEKMYQMIKNMSRNALKRETLLIFIESNWLLSIVISNESSYHRNENGESILWGYGLNTSMKGNVVQKPMRNCTGEEILDELLYHLRINDKADLLKADVSNVFPCMMPYGNAHFQPCTMGARPPIVPPNSVNFAMISQFVEMPKDRVIEEEDMVTVAKVAVYKLLGLPLKLIDESSSSQITPLYLAKKLSVANR